MWCFEWIDEGIPGRILRMSVIVSSILPLFVITPGTIPLIIISPHIDPFVSMCTAQMIVSSVKLAVPACGPSSSSLAKSAGAFRLINLRAVTGTARST